MEYRNAKYLADGRVDCEINHPVYGWIPFTADPKDDEEFGRRMFQTLITSGNVQPYVPQPPDPQALAENIRAARNRLLFDSDWTQLPDVPPQTRANWALYRQQLRDMPSQDGFPYNVVWPTPPQ